MRLARIVSRHPFTLVPPIFYLVTAAPTIGFSDTALLVDYIQRGNIESNVNSHPMTVLMGMLFNFLFHFQDLAFRANLVSVFFGSLTIIIFYCVVLREFSSRVVAAISAANLMVCQSMWWHSTIIENYATSAFLVTVALSMWCELRRTDDLRYLWILCGWGGFSILNHVQLSFLCLGIATTGIIIAARRHNERWSIIGRCAAAAAAGLLPWFALVLRDIPKVGSLANAIRGAFVGPFSGTFFSGEVFPSIEDTALVFWLQSPSGFLVLLGSLGAWLSLRRRPLDPVATGMLTAFLSNTVVFAFYPTWDKYAFQLESFVLLFFFCARGLHETLAAAGRIHPKASQVLSIATCVSIILPPYIYANIATWGNDPSNYLHSRYNNHYSENLYFHSEYIVNPNKWNSREVERFAKLLFETLPPDATFLDDDSRTYYPLAWYYQRYYHVRPDVSVVLVSSWEFSIWGVDTDTLAELISTAALEGRPFFSATTQFPTSRSIQLASKKTPLEVDHFPLEEGRWIYRLKSAAAAQ